MKNLKTMKKLSIHFLGLVVFLSILIMACEKKEFKLPGQAAPEGAQVRFYTLAHNLLDGNGNALQLNVKLGDKIINGAQTLYF
jgi:hypothetical protein